MITNNDMQHVVYLQYIKYNIKHIFSNKVRCGLVERKLVSEGLDIIEKSKICHCIDCDIIH